MKIGVYWVVIIHKDLVSCPIVARSHDILTQLSKYGYLSGKSSDNFQSKCRKLVNFVSKSRKETNTTEVLFKVVSLRAKSHASHVTVKMFQLSA